MNPSRRSFERALVGLYPSSFRKSYEDDLVRSLRDAIGDARSHGGLARLGKTFVVHLDFAMTGIQERLTATARLIGLGSTKQPSGRSPRGSFDRARNIRHAVRSLARSPVYTVVALLTLSLGIGAGASVFAVVNAVLLRPLPYPEPEKIVTLWEQDLETGPGEQNVSPPNFADWLNQSQTLSHVAAVVGESFVLQASDGATKVTGRKVTSEFFDVFRTVPVIGRTFDQRDVDPGASRVVVISHGFWQRWFGADPEAIGTQLEMDGSPYRVIGVLPPEFAYGGGRGLWVPLVFPEEQLQESYRGARYVNVVGRVGPMATVWEAQQELSRIVRNARGEQAELRWGAIAKPLQEHMIGDLGRLLWLILGAVGVVVVVVCANLANLSIARGTARAREMSVRLAMGASRGRIFVENLTENTVLCFAGGLLGILLAALAVGPLISIAPVSIPRLDEAGISWEVGAFVGVLTLLVSFLLSSVTALRVDHKNPASVLRGESGATSPRQRLRAALIMSEIALSLTLLVMSGLLTKSFFRLNDVDPGFVHQDVSTVFVGLPDNRFPTDESKGLFYANVLESLNAIPGIEKVAFSTSLPMGGSQMNFSFNLESAEDEARGNLVAEFHSVSPDYFETLGIPVLRGHTFSNSDPVGDGGSIIVNEAFARMYFPGREAISERVQIYSNRGYVFRTIVGVIGNVMHEGLASQPREEAYVPMEDMIWGFNNLVVKSNLAPHQVTAIVRNAVREIDPGLPVDPVSPLTDFVSRSIAPLRFQSILFGLFASSAVILSAIGLYGLIAYVVGSRAKELGIRVALGARAGNVINLILGQGAKLTLGGLVIGLLLSLWISGLVSGMLFEVETFDAGVFVAALLGVAAISLSASLVPAIRAGRVDPIKELRNG
jgi:putative ABC transport system permease protein